MLQTGWRTKLALKYKMNLNSFAGRAKKYGIGNYSVILPTEPFETDFLIDCTDIKIYVASLHTDIYIQ